MIKSILNQLKKIKSKKALAWSEIGWFLLFLIFLLIGIVVIVLLSNKANPILDALKNILRFGK